MNGRSTGCWRSALGLTRHGKIVGRDELAPADAFEQIGKLGLLVHRQGQDPQQVEQFVVPFVRPFARADAVELAGRADRAARAGPGAIGPIRL